MLEYIILGFLQYKNMSGYDIKRFMENSIAYFYDASFGSIYPMLQKMQREGTVTMTETAEGGKIRKEYAITEAGRAAFHQWLRHPITLNRTRHDHLVRIFFYRWLPKDQAVALIQGFIHRVRGEIGELTALRDSIQHSAGMYEAATLDYGIQYYHFTVGWCEEFLRRLEKDEIIGKDCML